MKESIKKWNYWWYDSEKLNKIEWIERDVLKKNIELLNSPHIKDIIGVRRAGKTFLMYQIILELIKQNIKPEEILYLNFDDPEFKEVSKTISSALEIKPHIKYVFLDEIQNINGWENDIRVYYDRKEFKQIFVSGSSASLISKDIGRKLTGRHITTIVTPISFKEYISKKNIIDYNNPYQKENIIHNLEKYMLDGGFPETMIGNVETKKSILVNTYNDILIRDIISRHNADPTIIKNISYYLMTNIGNPFSENSIAKILNIHPETVKKYLNMLEEVFLFYYIRQFSWKIKTQLKKDMKAYSIDIGLRNAVSFKFSEDYGKLAENVVLTELKRRYDEIFFWKENKEVDFVIKENNIITAINVTYTNEIKEREINGLIEFKKTYKNAKLIIITKDLEKNKDNIKYVPLWRWLLD
jgi:uncharacterized protein